MIYLTKGQKLFNNDGMVVYDPTGYYEDGAPVICAMSFAPEEPVCRYEAKFIAYGDQVYNIGDEKKLNEEIEKIDPETLIGKTNKEVTVDNLVEEIKTVENPTPELTQEQVDKTNTGSVDSADTNTKEEVAPSEKTPEASSGQETSEVVGPNDNPPAVEEGAGATTEQPTPSLPEDQVEVVPIPEPENNTVITQPVSVLINKTKKRKLT